MEFSASRVGVSFNVKDCTIEWKVGNIDPIDCMYLMNTYVPNTFFCLPTFSSRQFENEVKSVVSQTARTFRKRECDRWIWIFYHSSQGRLLNLGRYYIYISSIGKIIQLWAVTKV